MEKAVEKVTYEIYLKSFYDSNNDGIGDLVGITTKLNYLARLGVDAIMIDGLLVDPQQDVNASSSFYEINPVYGTLADFDQLVTRAHQLDIEVGIKFSINHTALTHPWFQRAQAGDIKYQNYYLICPQNQVTGAHHHWLPLGTTQQAYLHVGNVGEADLNWRNPDVITEFKQIFEFWIEHQVSIFQLQDVELIGKDMQLNSPTRIADLSTLRQQLVVEYLDLLDNEVFQRFPQVLVIIEQLTHASARTSFKKIWAKPNFVTYSDTHLLVDYQKDDRWTLVPYDFEDLRHVIHSGGVAHQAVLRQSVLFWDNPEQSRALNRFILQPEYYKDGAKLLGMILLAGQGVPMIYMGEEIGMEDPSYTHIGQYRDLETQEAYANLLVKGYTAERAFAVVHNRSSDNTRIPMQWEASEFGGFSNVEPWLTPGEYEQTNVSYEIEKDDSVFTFYRNMIALRKQSRSLQYGEYQPAYEQTPELFAFIRHYGNENLLILAHFGSEDATIELPADTDDCEVLLSNYFTTELTQKYRLRPYEALIIKY
ncbi:alpha-amylase family glycosyl hydrolase [Periweissella fabalis]|uniref:Glycosyl hydrolase family 13 catalytic domain-containing protein n=1 Tax=Periweissella fabalis TaxID=1070421 RepID=A0A7X6N679_9LACO|nr:alpha-amylase family glycosyl hydrolase [Periweissella fabalis]MCM0598103.1 hypothetical protein [Periweissella fabalis]NKZ24773.1 hypothetical protein [Periweissella fabalis]